MSTWKPESQAAFNDNQVKLTAHMKLTGGTIFKANDEWKILNSDLDTDVMGMASWLLPELNDPSLLQAQSQPPELQQRAQLRSPSQLGSPSENTPLRRQQLRQQLQELLHPLQTAATCKKCAKPPVASNYGFCHECRTPTKKQKK